MLSIDTLMEKFGNIREKFCNEECSYFFYYFPFFRVFSLPWFQVRGENQNNYTRGFFTEKRWTKKMMETM